MLAIALPTMAFVARETWSTEQGAHGPIVLLTGFWLIYRKWHFVREAIAPPAIWKPLLALVPLLVLYALTRITQIVELEGYVMYATLITGIYAVLGLRAMRILAFPLIYIAFIFPPPETIVYTLTMPLKLWISEAAVWRLKMVGYPIGSTGVSIQVGQYLLLVAAACSGLNSIISLSVLSAFYIYISRTGEWLHSLILLAFVVPVALLANFVRVLLLILITYHSGEAAAQGFLHNFAGITMFGVALGMMYLVDRLLQSFGIGVERDHLAAGGAAQ